MSFSVDIEKYAKKTNVDLGKLLRGTALSMYTKIVKRTPVDTSRLQNNWQMGLNLLPVGEVPNTDTTFAEIAKTSGAKAGDAIYIANNLEYAEAIEYGHSSVKAPLGMVRVTIAEFKRIVEQQARKIK